MQFTNGLCQCQVCPPCAIDNTTGQVIGLFLTRNECLYGYQKTMSQCCLDFCIRKLFILTITQSFVLPKQASRLFIILPVKSFVLPSLVILHELGIKPIFAKTPQSKEHFKHLWTILLDRLPVEFTKRRLPDYQCLS